MHQSGILILTHHISKLCQEDAVRNIVAGIKHLVSSTLYVHIANANPQHSLPMFQISQDQVINLLKISSSPGSCQLKERCFSSDVFPFLSKFYTEAAQQCRDLDVNILLHNIGLCNTIPCNLQRHVHCIISDCSPTILQTEKITFQTFVNSLFVTKCHNQDIPLISVSDALESCSSNAKPPTDKVVKSKGSVVIGGTYDHIHPGHKVLLSEASLLTHEKLVIGLTDGVMLERKLLSDLIEPWEKRKQQLTTFLCDIGSFQSKSSRSKKSDGYSKPILDIARITDPIGPAGFDPDLNCIVVSKETVKGGNYVNDARRKNNLNSLEVHIIGEGNLVGDQQGSTSPTNEVKFSSSTIRYESLGSLRKPPNPRNSQCLEGVYLIGLTGGIASGKSSVAKRLSDLGAIIIDCDKLGHQAYEPDTKGYTKVVKRFGHDVVSNTGKIDRKVLASVVFTSDSSNTGQNLQDLNSIIWPEIYSLSLKEIKEAVTMHSADENKRIVCVLDAAVLIEAGWDQIVDEVWVCIIPPSEAVKRIVNRDGRSEEEAQTLIKSQMSGRDKVKKSHVVLSTFWDPSFTEIQVQKAWTLLKERTCVKIIT